MATAAWGADVRVVAIVEALREAAAQATAALVVALVAVTLEGMVQSGLGAAREAHAVATVAPPALAVDSGAALAADGAPIPRAERGAARGGVPAVWMVG